MHMRGRHNSGEAEWSGNWGVIKSMAPYLLEFPFRVFLAMLLLALAKAASVIMPLFLKNIVDSLSLSNLELVTVPLALLAGYGLLRFGTTLFAELRDLVFSRVAERGMRRIGLTVFQHVHSLDLGFHLDRKTGGLSRDIDRGTNGISFLLRFMLFNIVPTILELLLISFILFVNVGFRYVVVTLVAVTLYIIFSIVVTDWRLRFVREMNENDNKSNTRAIDSLLNFETVKYFGNESYEANIYDQQLETWENSRVKSRYSLFALNTGQALIIAAAITTMMFMAAFDVKAGHITIGAFTMVNLFMFQLFLPLNFLGFVYREIKTSLANIEKMFGLLDVKSRVADMPNAYDLKASDGEIEFRAVDFSYQSERKILKNINFTVPAGKKLAIVGPSGSGKSTIARLLFRFYDVSNGAIYIDGQDISKVTQTSVRKIIGVVPQDTVLFNESIAYNIGYGDTTASQADIASVAATAQLTEFIEKLPEGYETTVGERGLKLSGGEKQRIAIARTLLKKPAIMIFDEATSSLDSNTEKSILTALDAAAKNHTTIAIAHRLSTISDADQILVLKDGEITEQGSHENLLSKKGLYASMWENQLEEQSLEET